MTPEERDKMVEVARNATRYPGSATPAAVLIGRLVAEIDRQQAALILIDKLAHRPPPGNLMLIKEAVRQALAQT